MNNAYKAPVSNATRIAALVAVVAAVGLGWAAAAHESHKGVELSTVALSGQVTLPQVVVVARRDGGSVQLASAR